ncbi:MAG: fibronectin type III domain-containing protein, partial [Acutalibacteraceae bacterium]
RAYKSDSSSKYNGDYSVIDNFSVLPQKVSGVKCSDVSLSSFTLSWNAVAGADGYQIRKLNKETNLYEAVVSTTKTSYTFTNLKAGTNDTYKVRAYIVADGKKVYGTKSSAVNCYTYKYTMSIPSDFTVKTSYVTVKFDSVPEADKYYAYMLDSSTGKYVKCGETDKLSYQFTSLSEGNEYNVMIEAVTTENSKEIKLSAIEFIIKTLPGQVKGLKQTSSDGENASVSWTAVGGANAYRIYVYDSAKKGYSFIKEVKTNSYTFTGLSPLSNKNIKVLATVKNYGKKSYGKASDLLYVYTGPSKVKSLSFSEVKSDSISLKWKALSSADGYRVYSVNTTTGKETLLKTVKTNSCKVTSLKAGTAYSFIVRGYRVVNSTKITGSASSVLNVKTAPATVKGISVSGNTTTGYTLSWKAVDGANGYSVYRYNSKTKKYELLTRTTKTKLAVKNLTASTMNTYKISAYVTIGSKKYYGDLSEKYVAATLPKAPESVTVKKLSSGALKVTWKKASGVSGARVYIYDSKKALWSSVGITTSDNFTISADKINSSITKVRVKAYIKVNGVRYYSSATKALIAAK